MKIKLKFFLLWLKNYWLHLFYAITFLFGILLGAKTLSILEERNELLERNKQEAARLRQIAELAKQREELIKKTYEQTIKDINEKNDLNLKRLAEEKDKEIKRLAKEFSTNPRLMAERVNELFGIPIYPQ